LWGIIAGISDFSIVMTNMSTLVINIISHIKIVNYICNKYKVRMSYFIALSELNSGSNRWRISWIASHKLGKSTKQGQKMKYCIIMRRKAESLLNNMQVSYFQLIIIWFIYICEKYICTYRHAESFVLINNFPHWNCPTYLKYLW